jgi:hypothetical protein
MPNVYDGFDANRIKHMEMIQAIVSRLAGNSFLVKGWALTLAAAFFGFAVSKDNPGVAIAGMFPVILFFGLDVYFLQAERLFRLLYEEVRLNESNVEPFFLGATTNEFRRKMTAKGKDVSWHATSWRPTLLAYYSALVLASVVTAGSLAAG